MNNKTHLHDFTPSMHIEWNYLIEQFSFTTLQTIFNKPIQSNNDDYTYYSSDWQQYPGLKWCKLQIHKSLDPSNKNIFIKKYPNNKGGFDLVAYDPTKSDGNCELRKIIQTGDSLYCQTIDSTKHAIKDVWLMDLE